MFQQPCDGAHNFADQLISIAIESGRNCNMFIGDPVWDNLSEFICIWLVHQPVYRYVDWKCISNTRFPTSKRLHKDFIFQTSRQEIILKRIS